MGVERPAGGVNAAIYPLVSNRDRRTLDPAAAEARLVLPMINEAVRCLESGIVRTPEEVDLAMVMGTGFPPFRGGLLRWADVEGLERIVEGLARFESEHGDRFSPAPRLRQMAEADQTFTNPV